MGRLSMITFAIPFPGIDPVALSLGPISIKWYGLAYMAGILLGWFYITYLLKQPRLWARETPPFEPARGDDLLLYVTLGVILGGRLGQVLLYDPGYYFAHPADIVKVWQGGMSFHGALVGSGLAILIFARTYAVNARSVMDLCCAAVPFGLILGRVANFINSEHWGRPADVAWAVVFPNGGDAGRHPSQLYEAALEGVVMLILMRVMTHSVLGLKRPGLVTGVWLVWYAVARTICEFFREPESVHALNLGPLTAGQLYSLPMLLLGLWFIWSARSRADEKAVV
jgi:phosphatidylglycerol---prolipoprotein diacylglyceryl transferase